MNKREKMETEMGDRSVAVMIKPRPSETIIT